MKRPFFALIVFWLSIFAVLPNTNNASTPNVSLTMPPYVGLMVFADAKKRITGFANAVLVDKENKLILTNAHITNRGTLFMVSFSNVWYEAKPIQDAIRWFPDLALFKVSTDNKPPLPETAKWEENQTTNDSVSIIGYLIVPKNGKGEIEPYRVDGVIENTNSHFGINFVTRITYIQVAAQKMSGENIKNEDLSILYDNYTIIRKNNDTKVFQQGLSGSPATKENKAIGIISSLTEEKALIIPASEIKLLLNKITH